MSESSDFWWLVKYGRDKVPCPKCGDKYDWVDVHIAEKHRCKCPWCKTRIEGLSAAEAQQSRDFRGDHCTLDCVMRHLQTCKGFAEATALMALTGEV